ncbi:TIGR01440 family protein [Shouchella clausii]|jgi:uncharacterized protein (TIGR01440 family)|uniref:TIGR01440 family protein n=1 Tax=Shouchella TaxID=2893057 RepID=UPI000BA543EC|nr:TIGR01440 family protein [Shouchella clausii]MBX0318834.1 TIGR01440 family protein [Shouchella clausii]MDO7266860.1 TIGR01440 family protein [Shouchella clausii]MDO7286225.1 TIGR01440 family protein [Shouchella clausii]PAD17471.1 TIGR01440 family protein [Shouchella clausii]PAD47395.1 TIGR01440 family protein [Shouchella clausii]
MTATKTSLIDLLSEFTKEAPPLAGKLFVVGASTSEVGGGRIGKQGSEKIAAELYDAFVHFSKETGAHLLFQCCEHLNRALVVERAIAHAHRFTEVAAVPVPRAGGAMAAYAYKHMQDPVLVEQADCDAGIDIGDTFIGMHLKPVAVPVRVSANSLGSAHVTFAYSRPKLIGGERARYSLKD